MTNDWKSPEFWGMAATFIIHGVVQAGWVPEDQFEAAAARTSAALLNMGAFITFAVHQYKMKTSSGSDHPEVSKAMSMVKLREQLAMHETAASELKSQLEAIQGKG